MKKKFSRKIIIVNVLIWVSLSVFLFTVGCAAKASRMVPKNFEVVNKHSYTVGVNESTGGIDAKPLWTSQISNIAYTEALSNALAKSGVFQAVIKGGGADYPGGANYILDVTILEYDQPWHGANIIIGINTKWELTDAKTHESVWSNTFKTAYRAAWIESVFDGERIEKAHEAAVRTNIKEGIRRLSLLSL